MAEGRAWPPPPDKARVQFVTEFAGPSDLGIKPSIWSRVSTLTVGSRVQGMVRPMAVVATPDSSLVYVADPGMQCVHRFDILHSRYRCLGADPGGTLPSPVGMTIDDDGRIFVSDSVLNTVFSASIDDDILKPLTLSPPPNQPTGLALGMEKDLFVASTVDHSVHRYSEEGVLVQEYGGRGTGPGQMNYPTYLWLASQTELLVTDTLNFRVQRLDPDNGVLGTFGEAGDSSGNMSRPKGVAMDQFGHIYVVDGLHHALQIFDREGRLLLAFGKQGSGPGEFWLPGGIFVNNDNLILVADTYNGRVQVFRYMGDEP